MIIAAVCARRAVHPWPYTLDKMQKSFIDAIALRMLVCPACHAELILNPQTVHCVSCGRLYPIRDGLPVLIAEVSRQ
jgi:uncharacterized protein